MVDATKEQTYFERLDTLTKEERLDLLNAVALLKHHFPELSKKEAAVVVVNWVENHKKLGD